ncbi:hypothetical protein V6N11_075501 [Hibiscus sabdariffa]|uniref:Uncharacterized protein n=1 Tax=Hibiscus sabdariffa TaxID=183260 RepID=A0ABR2R6Q4_9ROSI
MATVVVGSLLQNRKLSSSSPRVNLLLNRFTRWIVPGLESFSTLVELVFLTPPLARRIFMSSRPIPLDHATKTSVKRSFEDDMFHECYR